MVSVPVRREQVAYAGRRGLSQRRSCTLLGVARSALGYRSTKAEKDAPVLVPMAALGAQYPRFGYRRIRIFLDREGHAMSWGRCYRLWRRARLQVPRKRPRKRGHGWKRIDKYRVPAPVELTWDRAILPEVPVGGTTAAFYCSC